MSGLFREKETKPRVVKTGIDATGTLRTFSSALVLSTRDPRILVCLLLSLTLCFFLLRSLPDSRRRRLTNANEIRKSTRDSMLERVRRAPVAIAPPNDRSRTEKLSPEETAQMLARLPDDAVVLQHHPTADAVRDALVNIRALLTLCTPPPLAQVVAAGLLPALIHTLNVDDKDIQTEALWCLTNVAAGEARFTRAVYEARAVDAIIPLLQASDPEVREQAVWALGNIAGDNAEYRDQILNYGALDALVTLAHGKCKISMLRNVTWAISNLCRGRPGPLWELVSRTLPTLTSMLNYQDDEVIADAAWAITGLTDAQAYNDADEVDMRLEEVVDTGLVPRLVLLLTHPNPLVKTAVLRVVGNLSSGPDSITDALIANHGTHARTHARTHYTLASSLFYNLSLTLHQCSLSLSLFLVLDALYSLTGASRRQLRKEACWVVSNITAGTSEQVLAVAHANIFGKVVDLMRAKEPDVRKESTWCITNAIAAKIPEVTEYLTSLNCINAFSRILDDESVDPAQLTALLEAMQSILEYGADLAAQSLAEAGMAGGNAGNRFADLAEEADIVDKISYLQQHHDSRVSGLAGEIIRVFFLDDGGDAPVAAAAAGDDGSFMGTGGSANAGTPFDF
jgi:hypothetical protein